MQASTLQQSNVPGRHRPGDACAHGSGDVDSRAHRPSGRGFTLIELLVTLAVAAILTAIAVPSFRNISLSSRLTSTANDVVAAIKTARLEAIKRNGGVQFCSNSASANTSSSALGTACASQGGAVYALSNGAAALVRAQIPGIDTQVKFNGDLKPLLFSGQGLGRALGTSAPFTGQVADICTGSMDTDNHRVISIAAGSVVRVETKSGDCP